MILLAARRGNSGDHSADSDCSKLFEATEDAKVTVSTCEQDIIYSRTTDSELSIQSLEND